MRTASTRRTAAVAVGLVLTSLAGCGFDIQEWLTGERAKRCEPYCARIVECELDTEEACQESCQDNLLQKRDPFGESCVLEAECAEASRCILCDQYCARLTDCEVTADADCASSCETLLQGGASAESYQCVVEAECEDISNCGI